MQSLTKFFFFFIAGEKKYERKAKRKSLFQKVLIWPYSSLCGEVSLYYYIFNIICRLSLPFLDTKGQNPQREQAHQTRDKGGVLLKLRLRSGADTLLTVSIKI